MGLYDLSSRTVSCIVQNMRIKYNKSVSVHVFLYQIVFIKNNEILNHCDCKSHVFNELICILISFIVSSLFIDVTTHNEYNTVDMIDNNY